MSGTGRRWRRVELRWRGGIIATVEEDGTLNFNGAVGKGVPVGRYKVVISGAVKDLDGKPTRRFVKIYGEQSTPLEVEVTEQSKDITIDLEKRTAQVS